MYRQPSLLITCGLIEHQELPCSVRYYHENCHHQPHLTKQPAVKATCRETWLHKIWPFCSDSKLTWWILQSHAEGQQLRHAINPTWNRSYNRDRHSKKETTNSYMAHHKCWLQQQLLGKWKATILQTVAINIRAVQNTQRPITYRNREKTEYWTPSPCASISCSP